MAVTSKTHQVVAAAIGNALEWYDFLIYGFFAVIIAKLFFPTETEGLGLVLTLATFGVGFFFRPVGGILLGYYADRYGRRTALTIIMGVMAVAITIMTFAPTYATIGIAAPLIVLLARILQGLSVGGEFSSATVFLVEHAPPNRKGLYGSWQMSSQGVAFLLAGLVGFGVTSQFPPAELEAWAWRLPFLIGLLIVPVALYIRRNLTETPEFERSAGVVLEGNSTAGLLLVHWRQLLVAFGAVIGGAVTTYVLLLFMPTYGVRVLKLDLSFTFVALMLSGLILAVGCPLSGALSDRVGWKPVMATVTALYLLTLYPAFVWLTAAPSASRLIVVQVFLTILMSCYNGPFGAALASLFPARVRSTALAIVYNIGVALFGGFAPFAVAWLIQRTGDQMMPAYFATGGVAIGFVSVLMFPKQAAFEIVNGRRCSPAVTPGG